MTAPVLLVLFRRPDLARQNIERVLAARPERLYISVDAARPGRDAEQAAVVEVRRLVETTDFPVPVSLRFAEQNLGAGGHVKSAVDWLFEREERGIVLEDDCIPSPSFFPYATTALDRHADTDVSTVAGFSPVPGRIVGDDGIRFSRYPMTWGWASWRNRWTDWYTDDLADWRTRLPETRLDEIGAGDPWFRTFWSRHFDALVGGSRDVWDYQWVFSTWLHGGRGIFPNVNLVQNRGFGQSSTNSFFARRSYAVPSVDRPTTSLQLPTLTADEEREADAYLHRAFYRVGRVFPVTATARGVARRFVNRYVRR